MAGQRCVMIQGRSAVAPQIAGVSSTSAAHDRSRPARRAAAVIGIGIAALMLCACGDTSPSAPSNTLRLGQPVAMPEPPPPAPNSIPLVGSYTMTLEIGGSCSLPEEARIRRYAASIYELGPDYHLLVTLGSATFLDGPICSTGQSLGLGCNQFWASSHGDAVQFMLESNDPGHGTHIVERLPSGAWVEITGNPTGSMTGESVHATGPGSVQYCHDSSSNPFPCSNLTSCQGDLSLTLTRR